MNSRGFEHLLIMFRAFDKYKDHLKDRYATAMAIFFKKYADIIRLSRISITLANFSIIYDPLADDNTDKSERVFREFAQETTFDSVSEIGKNKI